MTNKKTTSQTKKFKNQRQSNPQQGKMQSIPSTCQIQRTESNNKWRWTDWLGLGIAVFMSVVTLVGAIYMWRSNVYSDSLISLIIGITSITLAIWSIYFSWRSNRKTTVTLNNIIHNVDGLITANSALSNTVLTWQRTMDFQFAKQNVKTIDVQRKSFEYSAAELPCALILYACKKVKDNEFFISYNEIHPALASLAYEFLNNMKSLQPSIFECEFNNRGVISVKTFDKEYFKNIDQLKILTRARQEDVSLNIRNMINEGINKINQYYQK